MLLISPFHCIDLSDCYALVRAKGSAPATLGSSLLHVSLTAMTACAKKPSGLQMNLSPSVILVNFFFCTEIYQNNFILLSCRKETELPKLYTYVGSVLNESTAAVSGVSD